MEVRPHYFRQARCSNAPIKLSSYIVALLTIRPLQIVGFRENRKGLLENCKELRSAFQFFATVQTSNVPLGFI